MSETELTVSLPLDDEGFLRRACPECGREFKWLHSTVPEPEPETAPEGYFCPYCGGEAPTDQWFTSEQVTYLQEEVMQRVVNPALEEELGQSLRELERASGGLLSANLDVPRREHAPLIFEPNDMRRIEFACHPSEPLKIAENWDEDIHCLVCGKLPGASV